MTDFKNTDLKKTTSPSKVKKDKKIKDAPKKHKSKNFKSKNFKSKSTNYKSDPFASRESKKYDDPIPSREYIMKVLGDSSAPVKFKSLIEKLGITKEDHITSLKYRLGAMERDGQVLRNRKKSYCLVDKIQLFPGKVVVKNNGFGFVDLDINNQKLLLSYKDLRTVFHGDKVLVTRVDDRALGKKRGELVEITERSIEKLTGVLHDQGDFFTLDPDNKEVIQKIIISKSNSGKAKDKQLVEINILEYPTKYCPTIAKVTKIIGKHGIEKGSLNEIRLALKKYEIPHEWPEELQPELDKIPEKVTPAAKKDRLDLRELPLVTIDGIDAKDFDDAVYCQRKKNKSGWKLWVAIADVSFYVRPGMTLDEQAYERGTSVYFPNKVIPMLPEKLSNGLCSLVPDQERLCFACEMDISNDGEVQKYKFVPAVMKSWARLTYTQVKEYLEDNSQELVDKYQKETKGKAKDKSIVLDNLNDLYNLHKILIKNRNIRGALDFFLPEPLIEFTEDNKIKAINVAQRTVAHSIIEECMLLTNISAAQFAKKHKLPVLYRNHETPSQDKYDNLRDYLKPFGLVLGGGKSPEPKHFNALLTKIHSRKDGAILQLVVLRTMNQAVYEEENKGHFGLAYEEYTHFTSPIRRYPDLLLHRFIHHLYIKDKRFAKLSANIKISKKDVNLYYNPTDKLISEQGVHCTRTEKRADEATRSVVGWLKCEYMENKVGTIYDATITSVTSFGSFVQLRNVYIEGLVHISTLFSDYYEYDEKNLRLIGSATGIVHKIGDSVKVKLTRVDVINRLIDFNLVT